ncbi:MAG: M15 family metallopeptidase [Clostridia bacterium]|nr:M15 family metallopeptidase [Clostridia bacterium]
MKNMSATSNGTPQGRPRPGDNRKKRRNRAIALLALIAAALFAVAVTLIILVFCLVCRVTSGFSTGEITGEPSPSTETATYQPDKPYGGGFIADMRGYEEYFSPSGDKVDAFLPVVSAKKPYDPKKISIPGDLTAIPGRRGDVTLNVYAAKACEAMLLEMKAEGVKTVNSQTKLDLAVVSGYSDSDRGDEHCLGLTVDLHNCSSADVSFKNTEAYGWISENCWRFGFIVRYPEGKTPVTGVTFRPWQLRFVGRYHARAMRDLGLCLEEYSGAIR